MNADRRAPAPAELRVRSGNLDDIGKAYEFDRAEVVIGRAAGSDVMLTDPSISDRHAMVLARDGRHLVYDLGSSNGTFVNEEPVLQAELAAGDLLRCGDTVFEYVALAQVLPGPEPADNTITLNVGPEPARLDPVLELPPADVDAETPRSTLPPDPNARALAVAVPQPDPHRYSNSYPPYFRAEATPVAVYEDEEMSTQELIERVRRFILFFAPYRRSILALFLLGLACGVGSYWGMPPARKAAFEISLMPATVENPVNRYERSNIVFFRSAQQNFRSLALIEKTLKKLGFKHVTSGLVNSVQGRLEFTPIFPANHTYQAAFYGADGQQAVRFLETHLKLYLDTEIDKTLKVIQAERDFLNAKLKDTEQDLRRTEEALLKFKTENIDGLPDQARQHYEMWFRLQQQQTTVDREIGRINNMLALDRRQLATASPMVESRRIRRTPYRDAILDVERKLAEGRASGLGEEHPQMQTLKAKLKELQGLSKSQANVSDELETRRNPTYMNIEDSVRRLQASSRSAYSDRARISKELERIKGVVDRLPKLEAELSELTRSYDATKRLHDRLFNQLKTTELQIDLERASASARYDIIVPPHVAFQSMKKGVAKRGLLGAAAGLFLGLMLACGRRFRDLLAPTSIPATRALTKS